MVALGLAAELLKRPDVLLLDEPSNKLDADARAMLNDVLDDYQGSLLLVSHDRTLLDRMDRIAELHRGDIAFYGGISARTRSRSANRNGLPWAASATPNSNSSERSARCSSHASAQRAGRAPRHTT